MLTDARGYFVLQLPGIVRKHPEKIFVVSLLYEAQAPLPADTAQRVTLLLKRNSFRFRPYGCQAPADSVHMAPYSRPWDGLMGTQWAFLVQDSSIHQPRKLQALTFRMGEQGFVQGYFIVRIYKYNGPDQPPGEYLLNQDFKISLERDGLLTCDLSTYDILVPEGGFFVALESPNYGDRSNIQ